MIRTRIRVEDSDFQTGYRRHTFVFLTPGFPEETLTWHALPIRVVFLLRNIEHSLRRRLLFLMFSRVLG